MKLDELKDKLMEMAGQLVDKIEHEDNETMCALYLIQSRTCLAIAKDSQKLKTLHKHLSDGEHVLAAIQN